jgi:hypothetical protein
MHEESLHRVIRDYLTGEELEETSYEEFRQALARLMVEEKGYPKESLTAKVGVCFPVEGQEYTRMVDLVARSALGRPLLLVIFCSGEPGSYLREAVAAARLHHPPVPLALTTDTKSAELVAAATGQSLATGLRAIPRYEDLAELAATHPITDLSSQRAEREGRILYTYSEMLSGGCCTGACRPKAKN